MRNSIKTKARAKAKTITSIIGTHILGMIRDYVQKFHDGKVNRAAKALEVSEPTLAQWLQNSRTPNLDSIGPVLDRIGVDIVLRNTTQRDVLVVPVQGDAVSRGLVPEDACVAIPQLNEYCQWDRVHVYGKVDSWFLLDRNHPVVRTRKNLVAIRIGRDELEPDYHAGDILVVDLDDRQPDNACFMLVASPDGVCSIRRVSLKVTADDTRIGFSENVGRRFPDSYSLKKDYRNNWDKAIVGKVVAAFTCGQRAI